MTDAGDDHLGATGDLDDPALDPDSDRGERAETGDMRFRPGPVAQRFMDCPAFVSGLMGPVGGGKSTAAMMRLLRMAVEQQPFRGVRRTRFALVRNTADQLTQTVKPLIDEWLVDAVDGALGRWEISRRTFAVAFRLPDGTQVRSDWVLAPLDGPDDVRRLLSLQLSAAWVEEAREIHPEVMDGLTTRVGRFPSLKYGGVTQPCVVFSTNPPPLETWWHDKLANPPANWSVFTQPPALLDGTDEVNPDAENLAFLRKGYYEDAMLGKSAEWVRVYLRNQFGSGGLGLPVFRDTFRRADHVARDPLQVVRSASCPIVVGMDNGLTAAAVVGQQTARGRVCILREAFVPKGETMGVRRFLKTLLVPALTALAVPREHIVFVLDPACFQRSQVDEVTIAMEVERHGFVALRAPTNDPEKRVSAVEELLTRTVDGSPQLQIDPSCAHLAAAMDYGYRYRKKADGQSSGAFDKNHHSHIAESLQYFALHFGMGLEVVETRTVRRREVSRKSYSYT